MKSLINVILITTLFSISCSTANRAPKVPLRDASIAITVTSANSNNMYFVNTDYFKLRLLDELEDFQAVNLVLVERDENPEITLNLDIENFVLWPRDERVSRRRVSRNIVVGTDAAGKPVYQTVTAQVDIVQVQRRSNARFVANLAIGGQPPLKFQRSFAPSFNYVNTYIDNVYGDTRALDASMSMGRGMGIEPVEDDFLLILARQEMIRRLSQELRNYYNSRAKKQAIE